MLHKGWSYSRVHPHLCAVRAPPGDTHGLVIISKERSQERHWTCSKSFLEDPKHQPGPPSELSQSQAVFEGPTSRLV